MVGKGSGDRKARESLSEAHCPGCRGVHEGGARQTAGTGPVGGWCLVSYTQQAAMPTP